VPDSSTPAAERFSVKVDMHMHSMWSGDCTTTPDELAAAVAQSGVDVLCVTDHNTIVGAQRFAESGELGCRIIVGEELRTAAGEIIGLFLSDHLPFGLSPVEAVAGIRDQGGLVYIPHPFDPVRNCLNEDVLRGLAADGGIDAVEVFNAKTSLQSLNQKAADFAAEFRLLSGAGSDAHVPGALGSAYVEVPDFTDAASFREALRAAVVRGRYYDEPRPWRPRIVPSTRTS
jgi:predicted metal-dependent phosphoesterase TrpH